MGELQFGTLHSPIHQLAAVPELELDIIDETLTYFKANVFFHNFEIKVRRPLSLSSQLRFGPSFDGLDAFLA